MEEVRIEIQTPRIRLDGALKYGGLVGTGGEAKVLIQAGMVAVNGTIETRRSRSLAPGDRVEIRDEEGRPQARLEIGSRLS